MLRLTIYFEGRVQGVGFRYTTQRIAQNYPIGGFVQNLPDGRVLLVVEGSDEDADAFVAEVSRTMNQYLTGKTVDRSAPTGEFAPGRPNARSRQPTFSIRH